MNSNLYIFTAGTSQLIFRITVFIFLCTMSYSGLAISTNAENDHVLNASDYFLRPYPLDDLSQGIILIEIDQSKNMLERAYSSAYFDPLSKEGQVGYFNPKSQYRYHFKEGYFEEDLALQQGQKESWDGRFLNWLSMRQIDMARYFLIGVHNKSQASDSDLADIIGLNSSSHKLILHDSKSLSYSPIPNALSIIIDRGQLKYQDKTIQLRIKNPRPEKGLMDLLTDNVKLYYFGYKLIKVKGLEKQEFIFGDIKKLPSFLNKWSASDLNHNQPLKLLNKALQEIKRLSIENESMKPHQDICQRYVFLSIASSVVNSPDLAGSHLLDDCQKGLTGEQALTHFKLLTSDITDYPSQNNFTFLEANTLMKSIFRRLSNDRMAGSFQISGTGMEYFPDSLGVIYQSLYKHALKGSKQEVNWLGDLRATLIDDQGRLRSDNGDRKLGTIDEDPIVESCFDEKEKRVRFRLLTKPGSEENCKSLNYPYFEQDLGYLWQASDSFNKVSQESINRQRAPFLSNDYKRYIRTHIGQTEYDFVEGGEESGIFPIQPEWLNVSTKKEADEQINYIRGQNNEGFRNRQFYQNTYLLGDTANNLPTIVGKPSSNYHLLYGDNSYQAFLKQYQNRRSRVFIGANDGMLHSFNAGWFDSKTKQLKNAPENQTLWALGQEIWAFVPFSVFPYLSEISDKYYGILPDHHLNIFSQAPYIFDAQVFKEEGLSGQPNRVFNDQGGHEISRKTHPEGWGTLMVVGLGLGIPSYLIFDITDAEQAPTFLAEFHLKNMGSATSLPSVMTLKNQQGNLEWMLVLGSGTDLDPSSIETLSTKRTAGVYIVNLKDIQSGQVNRQLIELNESMSYVSGISAADWNLDGETDALYLNTASGSRNSGSLYRIKPRHNLSKQIILEPEKLLDAQAPLINRPQLSLDALDNRWIYLSTGQNLQNNKIIGLKEPRSTRGIFLVDTDQEKRTQISLGSLVDVSNISVSSETGELEGSWMIKPQLKENTVYQLEKRLMQFSDSSGYVHGWLRNLDDNEVPTGESKLFGGMLSQASYQSEYKNCHLSAEAFIHRLRFTTGTSWYSQHRQSNRTNHLAAELKSTKSSSLGSKAISSILLHEGDKKISQIQSSQNGNTQTTLEDSRKLIQSGEVSWREL